MSIGDLKNSGNKGNNFPWQHNVLLGLSNIGINTANLEALLQDIDTNTDQIEGILTQILATLQLDKDWEAFIVNDSDVPSVLWLEVRTWDQDTATWDIKYYLPGSTTPGNPVLPVYYQSPNSLLALILAELVAQTSSLSSIDGKIVTEEDDNAIPENLVLPTSIVELYGNWDGAWQRVVTDGNGSLSVAVSNLTGLSLEATQLLVKAVLDAIKLDTALINSNVVLGNITLNTIDTVLDAIKLDTANLDVALSTRATEATLLLVKGVLDTIKLDTAAINTNTDGIEALLTTIDAVLDTIKLDTANLDVALSTRATEATLLTRLSKTDFEARINTLGQKLMANSTPVVLASDQSPIPTTLPAGTNLSYYARYLGAALNLTAGAISISIQNIGNDDVTVDTDGSPSAILDPGISLTWEAAPGKTLGAFTFTNSSGSSLYIVTQVR